MQRSNSQWLDDESTPTQSTERRSSKRNIFQWWFGLTSIPEPPDDASFEVKDKVRRSRLLSTISFVLLVIGVVNIPPAIFNIIAGRTLLGSIAALSIFPVFLAIVSLNRSQRVIAASLIVVVAAELSVASSFLGNLPLGDANLRLEQVFVPSALFAVSLLPAGSVFLVALCNITIIVGGILFLPHTPALSREMQQNPAGILLPPVATQLAVAIIAYLWVKGSLRSLARADRAEAISRLEHQIGLQLLKTSEEKQHLEECIERIVRSHIDTLNNKVVAPLSLSEDTKILWPLVNVITSLQRRLRYSYQIERELRQLRGAVRNYAEFLYQHGMEALQYGPRTKTDLDMLLSVIAQSKRPPSVTSPLTQDDDYKLRHP